MAILLTIVACDHGEIDTEPSPTSVRDSAGIEIVENYAPEWGPADGWRVSERQLVLGGHRGGLATDSSHLVWRIRGLLPLSDGRVAVLSGGEKKVLLFESSGEFAGSIGREGRGPGEFGSPEHLQFLPGDTLVVWDFMLGPVAYFDQSGRLLRSWRIDVGALFAEVRKRHQRVPERVHLPLADGSFIVQVYLNPGGFMPPRGMPYRSPIEFIRIDSAYAAYTLGRWEEKEYIYQEGIQPIVPFAFGVQLAAGQSPPSVYISGSDRYEVHQFSITGTLTRIVRRRAEPIPITTADIEQWKAGFSLPWNWEAWDDLMAELPPRGFRPPIVGLLVDSEGHLWVADRKDPATSEWSIFDPAGRWLGTLEVPLQRVEWIGEDLILGVNEDPDTGVEVVEGYRLSR